MTRWYCCFRCNEVESYAVDEHSGDTTISRGHFMVCANKYDAMVTGFKSKALAEKYLAEHYLEDHIIHQKPDKLEKMVEEWRDAESNTR